MFLVLPPTWDPAPLADIQARGEGQSEDQAEFMATVVGARPLGPI